MLNSVRILLALTLALQTPAHAGQDIPPKVVHHLAVQAALDGLMEKLNTVHSVKDAEEKLAPIFSSEADRETARQSFRKAGFFPQVVRLNRGIGFKYQNKFYTITYSNIFHNQLLLNDKISTAYFRGTPLALQLELLTKKLESSPISIFSFLLPEANANLGVIVAIIMGTLTLIAGAWGNGEIQRYYAPKSEAKFCMAQEKIEKNLTLDERYANLIYCERFEATRRKLEGTEIPDVAGVPEGQPTGMAAKQNCRNKGEATQVLALDNLMGIKTKVTITFAADSPIKMFLEFTGGMTAEYKIEDKKIKSVSVKRGSETEFFSRDPDLLKSLATDEDRAKHLNGIKSYDETLKPILPFLVDCGGKAQAATASAAEKPATMLSSEVVKSLGGKLPVETATGTVNIGN